MASFLSYGGVGYSHKLSTCSNVEGEDNRLCWFTWVGEYCLLFTVYRFDGQFTGLMGWRMKGRLHEAVSHGPVSTMPLSGTA